MTSSITNKRFWEVAKADFKRQLSELFKAGSPALGIGLLSFPLIVIFSALDSRQHSESIFGYFLNIIAWAFPFIEMVAAVSILLVALYFGSLIAEWVRYSLDPENHRLGQSANLVKFSWTIKPAGWFAGILCFLILLLTLRICLEIAWKTPGLGWRAKRASWLLHLGDNDTESYDAR